MKRLLVGVICGSMCVLGLRVGSVGAQSTSDSTALEKCQKTAQVETARYATALQKRIGDCLQKVAYSVVRGNQSSATPIDVSKAAKLCLSKFYDIGRTDTKSLADKLAAKVNKTCGPLPPANILGTGGPTVEQPLDAAGIDAYCASFAAGSTSLTAWITCLQNGGQCQARQQIAIDFPRAPEWLRAMDAQSFATLDPVKGPAAQTALHAALTAIDANSDDVPDLSCGAQATGNATAADVLSGKTFSNSSATGLSGSMPDNGAVTLTPGTSDQAIALGYHNGSGKCVGDADLVTGNIKSGINLFGVNGSSTVVDTSGATAVASDILSGKTAYVTGSLVTGSATAGSNVSGGNGLKTFTITDGLYSGSKTATANDTNLAAGNIKTGVTIFGTSGTFTSDATAAAADILSGKTAYVNGSQVTGSATAGSNVSGGNGLKTFNIPDGLYSGTKTATANDTSLIAGNIKSGATIFGVSGSSTVVDTNGATAAAADIVSGKTAYANGSQVTGSATAGNNVSGGDGLKVFTIPDGLYSGSKTATANDAQLTAAHVKTGVTIFGTAGTFTSDATAAAADLASGKTAYVNGSLVTGSATAGSNVSGGEGLKSFTIPDGIYSGSKTATANDADLVSGNVRSGVNIFGVDGSSTVVDTNGATAVASDCISGKTAYVNGSLVTGSATAGSNVSGGNGLKTFTITDALYSGSKTATANDTNLAAGNIKTGVSIFGTTGTFTSDATAVASDCASGKTAYVNGSLVTGSATAGSNVNGANGSKSFTIPDGIYSGSKTATANDTNLVASKIKANVTIFGTTGVYTSDATAVAADIVNGKTAYVNGNLVTGNVIAGSNVSGGNGQLSFTIPDGIYTGLKTATASDANLIATNIKTGVAIFGVTGNLVGAPACGNGAIDPGESCDLGTLNAKSCVTQGFIGGILRCKSDCTFDTSACYSTRFVDNSNGTITDNQTGLMWEKKIQKNLVKDYTNLQDSDNIYPWGGTCSSSTSTVCQQTPAAAAACAAATEGNTTGCAQCTIPQGTCNLPTGSPAPTDTVWSWLAALNAANFGGHNDWRLAKIGELVELVDYTDTIAPPVYEAFQGGSCGGGCTALSNPLCSCTSAGNYYTRTTYGPTAGAAWTVYFQSGGTVGTTKDVSAYVRAVRSLP